MVKKEFNTKNNIPEGVWILSVVLFAGALLSLFMAFWMFNTADQFATFAAQLAQYGDISQATFVNLGLLFVALALVSYFIGRGLLKLQNRARIALILLVILTLAMSIYSLFTSSQIYSNVFTLIINAAILWYLFRKETIKLFKWF